MLSYLLAVAVVALIYSLMTLALNLQFGFTGLINFGVVGFFAIGAYTSALLSQAGLPLELTLPCAALAAGLAAWPVALLSLRLRIEYFAIVMLGYAETIRLVISQEEWLTGGVRGLPGIASLSVGLGIPGDPTLVAFALALACVVGAVLVSRRLVHSPFGRMIQAIRDDEDAVRALGKSPGRFKVAVFVVSCLFVGLSGGLYAHYITYLAPDQFGALLTFYIWVAMILGGAGSVGGALVGSAILLGFIEGSRFLHDLLPGVSAVEMSSVRLGVIGLSMMLLMRFRPQGLLGGKAGCG
ncbi:amino acid/amide ABC transporter membrane protein 2, HAAT family [Tistlia consotensis]|uniref:Amino acid/amide ABC transporter membrane protein 2, HAAT family n=1 Tax=Tistlia consotensis USBA 355 TaxID=560819 RepID=A0A1Y6C8E9_9PROT|nr:branched-chain amino acid ABC transporter permease [Tistlia consotensis]SMF51455.1 amino acid/amide ABC transporter membrane protein 2, HAAT family [Tistlia consotensis USBA 355]SNR84273.1 amino acid/amide ABC transporter membrane protein 2, HAAT family [Tistlia consotensis]